MTLAASVIILVSLACRESTRLEPKLRPAKVPTEATWAGGADGGAYIQCFPKEVVEANPCQVWNDYTGASAGVSLYQLTPEGRAATQAELKFTGAANNIIYLQGGLVLKRVSTSPSQ